MSRTQNATIAELITPLATQMGFELVRVRVTGSIRVTLQIMAERSDGTMSAADCAEFSRALSALFETNDPIEGAYTLEVSSPGIDRPLTRLTDFERWEGHVAKLELTQMMEGRKRFKGVLAGIEGDQVLVDLDGEEQTAVIPFALLAQAKLMMTDALIATSLRATRKAAEGFQESDETENGIEIDDAEAL